MTSLGLGPLRPEVGSKDAGQGARPTITILVPTYNRPELLPRALESARIQTFRDLEILVLDDAGPSATRAAVEPFARDYRFRYVRNPQNLGIAGNWRRGFEEARGDYVLILHDDDELEPTAIERLFAAVRSTDGAIAAFADHHVIDLDDRPLPDLANWFSQNFGRAELPGGPPIDPVRAIAIDRSIPVGITLFLRGSVALEWIVPAIGGVIDHWLLYQVGRSQRPIVYVPERLLRYRVHDGNMSSTALESFVEPGIILSRSLATDQWSKSAHQELKRRLLCQLHSVAMTEIVPGEREVAIARLREAAGLPGSRWSKIVLRWLDPPFYGSLLAPCIRVHREAQRQWRRVVRR